MIGALELAGSATERGAHHSRPGTLVRPVKSGRAKPMDQRAFTRLGPLLRCGDLRHELAEAEGEGTLRDAGKFGEHGNVEDVVRGEQQLWIVCVWKRLARWKRRRCC